MKNQKENEKENLAVAVVVMFSLTLLHCDLAVCD